MNRPPWWPWPRRRRLHRAARSVPRDPRTVPLTALPVRAQLDRDGWYTPPSYPPPRPLPRCPSCGRYVTRRGWCCWVCRFAADGGWWVDPWNPTAPWHDVHTEACERFARALDPRWYAGSMRRVPAITRPERRLDR